MFLIRGIRLILRYRLQATAVAAVERLIGGLGARFEAIEARLGSIEQRQGGWR